jgi:hypothetical protein
MSTEKTEEYVLQWRTPAWWGESVWEDFLIRDTEETQALLEARDRYNKASPGAYRVVRRVAVVTTTVLEGDDGR